MRFTAFLAAALTACASLAVAQSSSNIATVTATNLRPPSPQGGGFAGNPTDHIDQVCSPKHSSHQPDLSFPCNAVELITFECMFGPVDGLRAYKKWNTANSVQHMKPKLVGQSPNLQRICACESQFFDQIKGCGACALAHGATAEGGFTKPEDIASASSSYCAVSATPTTDLLNYMLHWGAYNLSSSSSSSSTYSDPLGSSTAVSLYFTPAVTGAAALQVGALTNSAGSTIQTSINTSKGQIVPTTAAMTGSSGATSTGGAPPVETEGAAMAGVMGVAAIMAML